MKQHWRQWTNDLKSVHSNGGTNLRSTLLEFAML